MTTPLVFISSTSKDLAEDYRPAIIDAPVGRGRVIYFANNPIYRWQTFGEHQLVFNALLFFNDMPDVDRRARK